MRVPVLAVSPTRVRTPLLVLPVAGNGRAHVGGNRVTRELMRRAFRGEPGEHSDLGKIPGIAAARVVAYGLGRDTDPPEGTRRIVGAAVTEARSLGVTDVLAALPEGGEPESLGRAAAEGAFLAQYRFTRYGGERARRERGRTVRTVTVARPAAPVALLQRGIRRGEAEVSGATFARDLVNEPAAHLTPRALASEAERMAKASPLLSVKVLGPDAIEKLGMGAFLAVARGSDEPPRFIHLTYKTGNRQPETGNREPGTGNRPVVIIGKGLTFDAGGYSLKTSEGMETMKIDMAGAAAVLGVFSVLPRLRPPTEVHGLIAACENLVSGRAMKPGDIVRTMGGKTVEVRNTDAEGRLTLADAIAYARTLKPRAIVDLATLTGACVVALGEEVAGLFSNDASLASALTDAARASGEPVWRLPLVTGYRELLKSELADLQNIRAKGHGGGAITAALFLREFVGDTPWAHLDIAGPAYAERQTVPYVPVGGTGFGVRLLLRYLESLPV